MSSPSTSSPASNVAETGNTILDALLAGSKWGGKVGTAVTVTYSFPWQDGDSATFSGPNGKDYSTLNEENATQHYGVTATQADAFRAAMQSWANVANITPVEVPDTSTSVGDIRVAWSSSTNINSTGGQSWGWAYFPNSTYADGGDVWISTLSSAATDPSWASGSYNYMSLIHELGHALGLQHPFEGTVKLPDAYDNRQYSVMAYNDAPNSLFVDVVDHGSSISWQSFDVVPDTPMVDDILAMQYLYGANMSYHTGNDVYTFDPSTPFLRTIWDAGGNDTISVSNFTMGCTIDLQQGHYSSIHIPSDTGAGVNWTKAPPTPTYDGTDNLGIAYGVVIENAVGGKGDDTLIGNSANNHLQGNAGINTLDGGDGVDTAIYTGNFNTYSIKLATNGYTVVAKDGSQGDALFNMERMSFKDVTVALSTAGLAEDALSAQYTALAQKFYVAYFGRPADANGLANMVAQFEAANVPTSTADFVAAYSSNDAVKGLIDSFGNSAESAALYHGSNSDFITSIYAHLLGRAPDQGGLEFWTNALDNGSLVRGLAALNIVAGAESNSTAQGKIDAALIANRVTVADNFTLGLSTPALAANYAGDAAANAARTLLDGVNQNTGIIDYENTVLQTISQLPVHQAEKSLVQLVGVHGTGHEAIAA